MNRKVIILVISIIVVLIILSTTTYALFFRKDKLDSTESYTAGILDIVIENDEEGLGEALNLANSLPITDSEGKKSNPYKFKITNKGNLSYTFDLLLNNTTTSNQINADYIKIMIDNKEPVTLSNLDNNIIASDLTLNPGESKIISIRVWLDINTPNTEIGKVFSAKIVSNGIGSEYVESKLAADVILNIYNDATKTQVVNNSVTYNYAKEVNMMEDIGKNVRYYGTNPNNYVLFNDELWRIIGVFKDIDNGTGNKQQRLKIIRDENIGEYEWDSNNKNEWPNATLNVYLNGEYLNSLTSEAVSMIDNALWNLGGSSDYQDMYANDYYTYERGTTVYSGHSTSWTGKIALMYSSDYMYAGDLSKCNLDGYNWNDDTINCRDTSWLKNTNSIQWTLTNYSSNAFGVFNVFDTGIVDYYIVFDLGETRPVLYLKHNVQITSGDGSSTNPYILSLE